jgi:cob(I)alamin adenosyltransferase
VSTSSTPGGRGAPEALVAAADLATEMRPLKHYYEAGVKARPGIEF